MKRQRGTGRVYQQHYRDPATGERRPCSTWSIQYYDRHGRQHREHGFKSAAAGEKKLRTRLAARDDGRDVGAQLERTTFEDLARLIRDDYAAHGNRSGKRLEVSLVHLAEYFGRERAVRITEDRVTAYVAHRRAEGAATATVNRELAALKRAFRLAARASLVPRRPDIVLYREDNARKGFFEEAQYQAVLAHLPAELQAVVTVAYITGWRLRSEILTRQWQHVDLKAGWLRLEPGETKGPRDRPGRQFPVDAHPELRRVLEEQLRLTRALEQEQRRVIPWVFHRGGQPIRYFRRAWTAACVAAGLGSETRDQKGRLVKRTASRIPHDFRRTAVRNMERAGVPRSTAMALVGHRTESVYRRYAITDATSLLEGARRLAAWHQGAPSKGETRD